MLLVGADTNWGGGGGGVIIFQYSRFFWDFTINKISSIISDNILVSITRTVVRCYAVGVQLK